MEIKQNELVNDILTEDRDPAAISTEIKLEQSDSSDNDDLDLTDPNIKIKLEAEVKHELEIQLIDPNNAKKYDRLSMSAEKSKIPFKRRHSECSQNSGEIKLEETEDPENSKKYRANDNNRYNSHHKRPNNK